MTSDICVNFSNIYESFCWLNCTICSDKISKCDSQHVRTAIINVLLVVQWYCHGCCIFFMPVHKNDLFYSSTECYILLKLRLCGWIDLYVVFFWQVQDLHMQQMHMNYPKTNDPEWAEMWQLVCIILLITGKESLYWHRLQLTFAYPAIKKDMTIQLNRQTWNWTHWYIILSILVWQGRNSRNSYIDKLEWLLALKYTEKETAQVSDYFGLSVQLCLFSLTDIRDVLFAVRVLYYV